MPYRIQFKSEGTGDIEDVGQIGSGLTPTPGMFLRFLHQGREMEGRVTSVGSHRTKLGNAAVVDTVLVDAN
jgi:hypothetical protein